MDQQRFDAALRALQAGTTRRAGLAGMLGVLLGGAVAGRHAAAKGRGEDRDKRGATPRRGRRSEPGAVGPCGDGREDDNRCARNGDCCTKYCADGVCRCKPNWMRCGKGAQCCSGNCVGRRCDGGAKPAGIDCTSDFNCQSGLICSGGVCTRSPKAKCTKRNCTGCCEGTVCRTGKTRQGCGVNAEACDVCRGSVACVEGKCGGTGGGCSAATCADGCCQNGSCNPGDQPEACGTDGNACKVCGGSTPLCVEGVCGKCTENSDCPSNAPVCDANVCVECAGNGDCSTGKPICDANVCVECAANIDCPSSAPICDAGNCRALRWTNQTTFGTLGFGPGNVSNPYDVFVSVDGLTAWVADTLNGRISVWTRPGTSGGDATAWTNQTTFGTQGTGPGNLLGPEGVSVSADGLTAWVADRVNSRISIWTRPGTSGSNATAWTNQTTFGFQGEGPSSFVGPSGVAVSADELTVWVSDFWNSRISVWTRPGTTGGDATAWTNQTTFGTQGIGPGNFNSPRGVCVSADGLTIWVADSANNRISIWTRPGTTGADATAWTNQTTFGTSGSGSGTFSIPGGVSVSADGLTAWVADSGNNWISVWKRPGTSGGDATAWTNQTTFGTLGTGPGNLNSPWGVFVSVDELTVWVADADNNRISVWIAS